MMGGREDSLVAIALARSAQVRAWRLMMSEEEREVIERLLRNLFELGQIVGFSIRRGGRSTVAELVEQLQSHVGGLVLDACRQTRDVSNGPDPAFLMPIWPFDHEIGGAPASTAQFLGLDLELIATPSPDEELGVYLPGRAGPWLIHARPMF